MKKFHFTGFMNCALLIFVLAGCKSQSPTEQNIPGENKIIVDNLSVQIFRDETTGFLEPALRYDVDVSAHRTSAGLIDWFEFQCGEFKMGVHREYGEAAAAGTPFRYQQIGWENSAIKPGESLLYSLTIRSADNDIQQLVAGSKSDVELGEFAVHPRDNTKQIATGFSPRISYDDQFVYFIAQDENTWQNSVHRVPIDGGASEFIRDIDNTGFYLCGSADYLFTTESEFNGGPDRILHINRLNLTTKAEASFSIIHQNMPGLFQYFPDESHIILLLDDSEDNYDLLQFNFIDGKRDTLFAGRSGVRDMQVAFDRQSIFYRKKFDEEFIEKIDLNSGQESTYLTLPHENYSDVVPGPDQNYFYYMTSSAEQEFHILNQAGARNIFYRQGSVDEQLTIYPGIDAEMQLTSDGRTLVFSSERRNESQIWRLSL